MAIEADGGVNREAGQASAELKRLAELVRRHAPHDGSFDLAIAGLHVARASRPNAELVHHVQSAALCVVVQGAKCVTLGNEVYEYDASRLLVYSIDLPVAAQVTRASRPEPYLSLRIDLDPGRIANLVARVYPHGLPRAKESRAICLAQATGELLNAMVRLFELLAQPNDAELLAGLVIDEILIRLLRSEVGPRLAQVGIDDSGAQGVAKAVAWLRANYNQPIKVEDLARLAGMSVSSFYEHFKAITSMSPVQYQKILRLQEARRLMLASLVNPGTASWQVGYQSASQFSREYSRFFGSTPSRDIARLRDQGLSAADVSA